MVQELTCRGIARFRSRRRIRLFSHIRGCGAARRRRLLRSWPRLRPWAWRLREVAAAGAAPLPGGSWRCVEWAAAKLLSRSFQIIKLLQNHTGSEFANILSTRQDHRGDKSVCTIDSICCISRITLSTMAINTCSTSQNTTLQLEQQARQVAHRSEIPALSSQLAHLRARLAQLCLRVRRLPGLGARFLLPGHPRI